MSIKQSLKNIGLSLMSWILIAAIAVLTIGGMIHGKARHNNNFLSSVKELLLVYYYGVEMFWHKSKKNVKFDLRRNLSLYNKYFQDGNVDSLMSFLPPRIKDDKVFYDGLRNEMITFFDSLNSLDIEISHIALLDSTVLFKYHLGNIHSISQRETIYDSRDGAIKVKRCLYALSEDIGTTWIIMECEALQLTFPEFSFAFELPYIETPEEIKCQKFMLSPFGNKVCVDRYLRDRKYVEVLSTSDSNRLNAVKFLDVPKLSDDKIALIKIAVLDWIKDFQSIHSKATFDAPIVNSETVLYAESYLAFTLCDIYNIPIKYSIDNSTINDTLRGSFNIDCRPKWQRASIANNPKANIFHIENEVAEE